MRTAGTLTLLAILLAVPGTLRAGLYNTSEPMEDRLDPKYDEPYHRHLLILRSIGVDQVQFDNPQRRRYLLQDALAAKADVARLPVEQQINLSAVLIRRNKPDAALRVLMPLAAEHRQPKTVADLLVQANLATAYFLAGHEARALDHLDTLLDAWPKDWDQWKDTPLQQEWIGYGWSEAEFSRFREAEVYLRKLFRARARQTKEQRMNPQELDPLFEVKFVGDNGEFQAGKIRSAEKIKLPKNATDIVEQLVNWLPFDDRLYWLLGEVMNAEGNTRAARLIFSQLIVDRNFRAEAAKAHRQALMEFAEPVAELPDLQIDVPQKDSKPPVDAAGFDLRSLLIAFGAGVAVTIFALLQIREIQRRRNKAQAPRAIE